MATRNLGRTDRQRVRYYASSTGYSCSTRSSRVSTTTTPAGAIVDIEVLGVSRTVVEKIRISKSEVESAHGSAEVQQ